MMRLALALVLFLAVETDKAYVTHPPVPISEYTHVDIDGISVIVPQETWRW